MPNDSNNDNIGSESEEKLDSSDTSILTAAKSSDGASGNESLNKPEEIKPPEAAAPASGISEPGAKAASALEVSKPEAKKEDSPEEGEKKNDLSKLRSTSSASSQAEEDSLETEQVVVFKLENEEYAAPILDVQEIIPTGDITAFPNVPSYISGIINVRGTVATVINLAEKFNLSRKSEGEINRYIILTTISKALFGITVDDVTSVMKVPANKIKSANAMSESKINKEYVSKVAVIDDRVILILDFKKILDEEAVASFASETESKVK